MKKVLNFFKKVLVKIYELFKRFKIHNFFTYFFDLLILGSLILFFVLEKKEILFICKDIAISNQIIVVLIPTVITILAIAMQFQNEKHRGISIREFELLRTRFYFNLIHMSIIIIVIFVFETLFQFYSMSISLLALDGVAVIYSVVFIVQEMPVFSKNEFLTNIVLKRYLHRRKGVNQEYDSRAQEALTYTILTYGCKDAFKKFYSRKYSKIAFMNLLLGYEIDFYTLVLKQVETGDKVKDTNIYGINLLEAIKCTYDDLVYLLNPQNKDVFNLEGENKDFVFTLTRLTFFIYRLSSALNIQEKNNELLDTLINSFYYIKKDKDEIMNESLYRYMLMMSVATINNGESWFLESIRDRTFVPLFFDSIESPLTFFLTFYICFFLHSSANKNKIKNIEEFVNQPSKGINSEGYRWCERIKSSLQHEMSGLHFLKGVVEFLKIKNFYPSSYFEIRPETGGVYTVDDRTSFSDSLFFDYCLQIILFNNFFDLDEKEISKFFNSLSEPDLNNFLWTFETRYMFGNRKPEDNIFYNFIFERFPTEKLENNYIYKIIAKYKGDRSYNEYIKDESTKLTGEDVMNIESKICSSINSYFNQMTFKDDSLPLQKCQRKYFSILLDAPDHEELLKAYLKNLEASFNNIIRKELIANAHPIKMSSFMFNKTEVEKIFKFKPKYGNSYSLESSLNENQKEKLNSIIKLSHDILPENMFLKEGCVRVRFEFLERESKPRHLTNKEIEIIIDRDYTIVNGYYRFNKYSSSTTGNFFVTRNELIELIKQRKLYIPIVFRFNIKINKRKILYFKRNFEYDV